jgi:hypothetical protein
VSSAKKKHKQRAVFTITESKNGNFGVDLTFEPSIKGREETPEVRFSRVVQVAREISQFVLSNYLSKPIVQAGDSDPKEGGIIITQ